ncbi:MAG: penicillin-binding protein 2 [Candidatus Tectomicrobia bacterium]
MRLVVGLLGLSFLTIVGRLYTVQIAEHTRLRDLASGQYTRSITLRPERGRVLDRRGRVLATSVPVPSVYVIPHEIETLDVAAVQLARVFEQPVQTMRQRLQSKASFVWLARQVAPQTVTRLRALGLKGLHVLTEMHRYYPKRHLAGQVLGFVGVDGQALGGLEYRYDRQLSAKPRRILLQRDAIGRWVRLLTEDTVEQSQGADLYVTLDERLQYMAEKEIEAQVRRVRARSGLVVMMQPHTGDILAMALYPFFNPNAFQDPTQRAWQRNRSVTDSIEPGSTFKIVMAAATLEENTVRPGERFFCENGTVLRGRRLLRDHKPHGYLTFAEVFVRSSNIGAVKIGERLSSMQFYQYIRRFGFGEKTLVDLPGEHRGQLRHPRQWSRFSHDSLIIGQEIAVTPLQLVTAFAAVANGGWLMQPRMVKRIVRTDGVQNFAPQVRRRILSRQTTERLTTIFAAAVAHGTGRPAAVEGYRVAGKTGTAQKADPAGGGYSANKVLASFVGYAPAEAPQLVILVMVDEPEISRWGSQAAAPVFRRVAQQALHYLQIPPQHAAAATLRSIRTHDAERHRAEGQLPPPMRPGAKLPARSG